MNLKTEFENEGLAYSLIAYKDPVLNVWTLPQCLEGSGEEFIRKQNLILNRAILSGKIHKENDGTLMYCLGEFDDSTGKFNIYDEPKLIGVLKYIEGGAQNGQA